MEYTSREEPLCALDLPDEVLVLILGHLPLLDLATARLVSRHCRSNQRTLRERASVDSVCGGCVAVWSSSWCLVRHS